MVYFLIKMGLDHLTLDFTYAVSTGKFVVAGNVKEEARSDLVAEFLRTQMGAGADKSKSNEQDTYHITLRWYPNRDRFVTYSDTGNKSLRDGILAHFLAKN